MTTQSATAKPVGIPPHMPERVEKPDARWAASPVAAAVALGRMPGEPANILKPGRPRSLIARLFGAKAYNPLANPRLEVVRAISASLTRGAMRIDAELVAAARRAGWTTEDLGKTFPGVPMQLS